MDANERKIVAGANELALDFAAAKEAHDARRWAVLAERLEAAAALCKRMASAARRLDTAERPS